MGQAARDVRTIHTGELVTRKQAAFIQAYVENGGNVKRAAAAAGYSDPEPHGYRVLRDPAVLNELNAVLGQYDTGHLLPAYLGSIAEDIKHPDPTIRAEARREYGRHLRNKLNIEERINARQAATAARDLDPAQLQRNLESGQQLRDLIESQLATLPDPADLLA